jgi:hypothetical protein
MRCDDNLAAVIHASLAPRDLLPQEHLVDKGSTDADMLVASQHEYGVAIIGPVADDPSWQARAGEGFDKSQFRVDWEHQSRCYRTLDGMGKTTFESQAGGFAASG